VFPAWAFCGTRVARKKRRFFSAPFVLGLRDLGYFEGQNIVLEHRFPAERPERFESLAAELVQLKVDILVAAGQPSALALQRATTTIPIVFVSAADPIGVGLVASLARPSGNITGLSFPDLIGKRLEILKEALSGLSRVAVLVNATNSTYAHRYIAALQNDARALKLVVQPVEVNGPSDLERAFLQSLEKVLPVSPRLAMSCSTMNESASLRWRWSTACRLCLATRSL
jgi:putative ABC transport system substrate-binding protein